MICPRFVCFSLAFFGFASLPAQTESEQPPPTTAYRFLTLAGKIGDKAAIRASLWVEPGFESGSQLTGTYHYLSQRKPIHLQGRLEGDATTLEESLTAYGDDITGRFVGRWKEGEEGGPVQIEGTWTSGDGKRKLPFTLAEAADPGSVALDFYSFEESYERKRGEDLVERKQSLVFPQLRAPGKAAQRVNAALRHLARQGMEATEEIDFSKPAPTLREVELSVRAEIPRKQELAELEISHFESLTFHDAFEVVLNESGLLCLRLFHTEYTGGAHGNHVASHVTFDLSSGDELTLDDMLKPGALDELTKLAEAALRSEHGLKPEDSLAEKGPLFEDTFELNDNWFLTAEGLGFSFDPYEIGPYAAGFIEPLIPFDQLKPLIKKGSLLEKLAEAP